MRSYPSILNPEIDTSAEFDENGVQEYQKQIGILSWAIEFGIIIIMTEGSCFSQHLCASLGHPFGSGI